MRQKSTESKATSRAPLPRNTPKGPAPRDEAGRMKLTVGGVTTTASGSVGFDKITEDSRCPTGVTCIWQGRVVAAMWASPCGSANDPDAERFSLTLEAGQADLATKIVQGKRFTLLEVEPYPDAKRNIDPSRYVITVQVEGLA